MLLEETHLIRVDRRRGRLPEVTVLNGYVELSPSIVAETPEEAVHRDEPRARALMDEISRLADGG
jgi:hypothetical protein